MMAVCWCDKQDVFMLSTAHSANSVKRARTTPKKPKVIFEYNHNMGLVDKCDMQISFTESVWKTLKWYKKLFFHFMDIAIYNSFILYKTTHNEKLQLSDFWLKLV